MALALVAQDAEEAFYGRQLERHGSPALLLGCAHGGLALRLAALGHPVVGVDPSRAMIRAAEERLQQEPAGALLRLVEADLRVLRLADRFPLVLCPHNTLSLASRGEDQDALLATVRHHLLPRGAFAFDVANPGGSRPSPLAPARLTFLPHLDERRRKPGEKGEHRLRRLRLGQLWPEDLDALLTRGGFVPRERYGQFDEKPFEAGDPRQVVVAQL